MYGLIKGYFHSFLHPPPSAYRLILEPSKTQCFPDFTTLLPIAALQKHNTENSKQIFPERELRGHSPNSCIHVSVSELYIPLIGLPFLLQQNRGTDRGNI